MTDPAIACAPDTEAELDELVNRIGAIRERLPNAVDRIERDSIEKEIGKLLFELITRAGDQFVGWLPCLYEQKINVEMLYWKIGLGPEQQAHVAAALDRFHGSTSTASPPTAKAEPPATTNERASTEAKPAGVKMTEPRATEPARKRLVISLGSIRADTQAQPRTSIFADKVSEYVEDMSRGDKFPPLVVFYDGKIYWLADGFHRYHAAVGVLGQSGEFECDVREGGLRDAVLFSCGTNAAHGIRRTNEDKRRAVMTLLQDPEWSHWSDREIARQCSVAHETVGKYREQIAAAPHLAKSPDRSRTVKRGGTTYTQNTAATGKRPAKSSSTQAREKPAMEQQGEPSPDSGMARERYPFHLPEFRVRRIEDELENLLSLEKTPSHKDVSRSWLKRIRKSLENELIEGGILPVNARYKEHKEAPDADGYVSADRCPLWGAKTVS